MGGLRVAEVENEEAMRLLLTPGCLVGASHCLLF